MKNANVYRFRDRVALNLPNCPTIYLHPKEARAIARAMVAAAKNIGQEGFANSSFSTVTVAVDTD